MKKIYFMRHGKAEDAYGKSDFERALLEKGKTKTTKVAKYLATQNIKPELLLVSMSQRTIETAAIICKHLKFHSKCNLQCEQ